jgi:Dyp-type peroxidase family
VSRDRLQPGVFFRPGERPPACWRLVALDVAPGARPREARTALHALTRMLAGLRRGVVRELRGQPRDGADATRETFADLTVLVGFGRRLFDCDLHHPPLTRRVRPPYLAYLPDAFPAIPRGDAPAPRGETDVVLQLTGCVEAAVNRAAVEVWKLIEDEGLPLSVVATFAGFGRPDGRGWLEFHDGVSNLESSQRTRVLEARGDPAWMAGGTYMAFLRLLVDLALWRGLDRGDQELVVGRDKLTGEPLTGTRRDRTGRARPLARPPGRGARHRDERIDPPQTTDRLVEASHIHRANQNRASPDAPAALRMFRQGYDYFDSIGPDGPAVGLNFVSFQSDLRVLQHVLHLPGWLADANFGGPARREEGDPPSPELLRLVAGGLYAVPRRGRPFPGASLFGDR